MMTHATLFFILQLGGFELAKTETSLRRSKIEESRSSYESPQKLNDINYEYTKECEIYRSDTHHLRGS